MLFATIKEARSRLIWRRILDLIWYVSASFTAYYLAYELRFDFSIPDPNWKTFIRTLPGAVMVFLVVALMFRLYTSMWSYFGFQDCLKYAWAMATGAIIFIPVAFASNEFSFNAFPRSSIPLFFLLLFAIEFGAKSLYRLLFRNHRKTAFRLVPRETCLIIGSVHEADQVIRNLQHSSPEIGHIVGIVTDEHKGLGATLHGSKVLGTLAELERIVATYKPQTLLILPPYDPPGSVTQILDQCAKTTVAPRFQIIPSISDLATGKIDFSTIRNVEIEDLLGRPKVEIETDRLKEFIQAKSVLVTGAGGSIGSELCRQVLRFEPEKLILFENSEFALFNIERELRSQGIGTIVSRIGDVRNKEDVSDVFRRHSIDVVYHAAAYKHVNLMEGNVAACFKNNVFGTANVVEAAIAHQCGHFILISTDKAVKPTSTMGLSKRLAEETVLTMPPCQTRLLAVRFGNVLGSSGSVIPIFKEQIRQGGPVTVTSPDATRFFMTIPEAVQLVMLAGTVGDDRKVMILEMGEPVKIIDLAKRLIELSGFKPEVEIPIEFSGLGHGEKVFEELMTESEEVRKTPYDKIYVLCDEEKVTAAFSRLQLEDLLSNGDSERHLNEAEKLKRQFAR